MTREVAILSSTVDPASTNIALRLLEVAAWRQEEGFLAYRNLRLVRLDEDLPFASGLERLLSGMGLHPDLVVFACRHKAQKEIPWLGGHFPGTIDESPALSAAAPSALRSYLLNLMKDAPVGLQISAEATHHGPSDMNIPCFFAEIGSSATLWSHAPSGRAVAKAILELQFIDLPVFLGFGGGHYMHRQTRLMMDSAIAFGHLFSNYQVDSLEIESVDLARRRSKATFAYLDRRSLRSAQRSRLEGILEALDIPIMREREILDRFPLESSE